MTTLPTLPCCGLVLVATVALAPSVAATREYGGRYTRERIANLRANCERHAWAQAQRTAAVRAAEPWVALDDDTLWRMVPGQKLPRTIDVSWRAGQRVGCPLCGNKIHAQGGNYPWKVDVWKLPWKVTCPVDGTVFPTNDFGRYYASGIDEAGVFDPERANRKLLVNAEHPDPADPKHTWGVDDGYGWTDEQGHRFLFVAYYAWQYWSQLQRGLEALSNAWLYTGERRYGHKALILLDRIADVYPDYDWAPYAKLSYYHSDGGSGRGKIEGAIWECGTLERFATAIDRALSATVDDPELYAFLADRAKRFRTPRAKGTRELLVANLDEGILRTGAQAVFDGRINGNEGMHQSALAMAAIALDTEPETGQWLDWLFEPGGGHIPGTVIGRIDRDGVGDEAAPGYALSWGINLGQVADLLHDYQGYDRHDVYRDLPTFAATFGAPWRLVVGGLATPNIGDAGSCGTLGMVGVSAQRLARGWQVLRDPELALGAWRANGNQAAGLGRDIFSADPDRVAREIAEVVQKTPPSDRSSGRNLAGYGLASLSFGGGREGSHLWLYYGRNGGHGHLDRLNFDLYYHGLCLLPDHGYPEYTSNWPQRMFVTRNTLSHNTVVVNQSPQKVTWVGHPELFYQGDEFGAVRVDSREVYDGLDQYQRTLAFVRIGETDGYAVDVFRVRGGQDHLYSLHGPPGPVTVTGAALTRQPTGTYAGPDQPFQAPVKGTATYGYSWFVNVERAARPGPVTVDWQAQAGYRGVTDKDDIHLRYHSLTPLDDLALADTQPPQNKRGNPEYLRYLLAHRTGDNLASTFVGVIEPYTGQPVLAAVKRLEVTAEPTADAVALSITLADGAVDYLLTANADDAVVAVKEGPQLTGCLAWLRTRAGRVERAALLRGTRLALGDFELTAPAPGWTGTVTDFDRDTDGQGYLTVDTPLPADKLAGSTMIIANDRVRNACYTIESVEPAGQGSRLCLGNVSFIRGYQDSKDYAAGYVYEFAPGAAFIIPTTIVATRAADGTWQVGGNTTAVKVASP